MTGAPLSAGKLQPQGSCLNHPAISGKPDEKLIHCCDWWNELGKAAFAREDWAVATEAFTNAIALSYQYHHYIHFDCSALFTQRAQLHLAAGNSGQALQDIKEAVFQDHNNPLKNWRDGEKFPDYPEASTLESNWQRNISLPGSDGNLEEKYFHPAIAAYKELHKNALRDQLVESYDAAIATAMEFHRHYHRHAAQHHINRGLVYFRLGTGGTETKKRSQETSPALSTCEAGSPCEMQEAFHGAEQITQETSPALSHSSCDLQEQITEEKQNNLTLALNDFCKACDLDKTWDTAWRCRGDARAALGNLRAAEMDYNRAGC